MPPRLTLPHRNGQPRRNTLEAKCEQIRERRQASAAGESSLFRSRPVLMTSLRSMRDTAIQPTGVRVGHRHRNTCIRVLDSLPEPRAVAPPHTLKMFRFPQEPTILGFRFDLDCWSLLDASNQVSRHVPKRCGAGRADERSHRLRQKSGGRAGRVAHAYHLTSSPCTAALP